jgi:hypothetical protein
VAVELENSLAQAKGDSQEAVIKVLGKYGDVELKWDAANEQSVADAKTEFNRLRKSGYMFYVITADPNVPGEEIKTFDAMHGALKGEYKKPAATRKTGVATPAARGG